MANQNPKKEANETETQPSRAKIPWGAVIGIMVLALVGFAMLAYAIYSLLGTTEKPPPTLVSVQPTQVVLIPTTTPAPSLPPTLPPTVALPTDTAVPAPTEATGPMITIAQPANIRSGPGLNYRIIGGLATGATAPLVGRDASAQWYVISYVAATSGQGWVSTLVATYDGDVNSLPVIEAPPPPPPTNTPPPPPPTNTSPPPASPTPGSVGGVRGLVADVFYLRVATASVNQQVWFNFKVTNTTDAAVPFGVLSAHTDVGATAESWSNSKINPHDSLVWEDHIEFKTPGTYQVYLGVCFGSEPDCMAGRAPWERLSQYATITVQ